MGITTNTLLDMSADLLDLLPDGFSRTLFLDVCKLAEETGEVAEAVVKSSKTDRDLGHELADVIAVCCVIALKKGIDLDHALLEKHHERINKKLKQYHNGEFPEGFRPRVW